MIQDTNDLSSYLSEKSGLPRDQADATIQLILDWIMTSLSEGDEVRFFGFGGFLIHELGSKEVLDPRTGEKTTLPATKRPILKGSQELRKMLNPEKYQQLPH